MYSECIWTVYVLGRHMGRTQLVPAHRCLRWVLARLAVGGNLTSRGGRGTNQQCSGGVVLMHQPKWQPRSPSDHCRRRAMSPNRILGGWEIASVAIRNARYRSGKPGSIVRDTHGRGDNPLQSPPLWADRFTQPHWIRRVVGITPNRVPESEAVGSTTRRQPVDGLITQPRCSSSQ
jgi:hypothetical protein